MLTLGIETSCDDTAAAIVEDGRRVLSSVVSTQDSIHAKYGGIVPELASRSHIESIIPVVEEALSSAGITLKEINNISVTSGPGLVGSILIGLTFAKSVSYATGKPYTGVNHITAHSHAAFLHEGEEAPEAPNFPFVSLIASGGHTTILRHDDHTKYEILGQTLDDASGEAFDKVAKLMGLGYPGGAIIDRLAKTGNPKAFDFTRPYLSRESLDFSFSGIKTAAQHVIKNEVDLKNPEMLNDFSASFQEAVVDVLTVKALRALQASDSRDLVVAGGVACNSRLRSRFAETALQRNFRLFMPAPRFCTDNGAMIAALGYHQMKRGSFGSLDTNATPTWDGF